MDSKGRELLVFREATSQDHSCLPAWRVTVRDLQEGKKGWPPLRGIQTNPKHQAKSFKLNKPRDFYRWCLFSSPICTKRCLSNLLLTPFPTSIIFQTSQVETNLTTPSDHLVIWVIWSSPTSVIASKWCLSTTCSWRLSDGNWDPMEVTRPT